MKWCVVGPLFIVMLCTERKVVLCGLVVKCCVFSLYCSLQRCIWKGKVILCVLLLWGTVGDEVDEVSALKTAQSIARQLHAITTTREHLKNYR